MKIIFKKYVDHIINILEDFLIYPQVVQMEYF